MSNDEGVKPDPGSSGPRAVAQPLDLDALSALCEAATKPPWDANALRSLLRFGRKHSGPWDDYYNPQNLPDDDDADYIVAAHKAMPALIARVRVLERERFYLEKLTTRLRSSSEAAERERERDEANARAATILQETTAALRVVRARCEEWRTRAGAAERERDELRAAVERVRRVALEPTN